MPAVAAVSVMSPTPALPRLDVFGDALPARAMSRCGTHRLWHPSQGDAPLYELNAVAFSPDSRQVVSAAGKTAHVWDVEDGREVAVLSGHVGEVEAVLYVSATRIATAGLDRTVRLWDATSGAELHRWTLPDGVLRLALSPDGRTLLAGTRGFVVLDLESQALVRWVHPEGSAGGTRALGFSPDGSRVVALERHNEPWRLGVYDVETWTMQWSATGELYDRFAWAAFSVDGRTVSCPNTGPGWRSAVRTYDTRTGALLEDAADQGTLPLPLPDGGLVRMVHTQLVFLRGGVKERTLEIPTLTFCGDWEPVVSPDGRWLSFAGGPTAVLLLDLRTGATHPERAHRDPVLQATFSEDGRHLLTYSSDGTVRRWDCDSGRQVDHVALERLYSPAIHLRDGRALVASARGSMLIQDVFAGSEVEVEGTFSDSAVWSEDRSLLGELSSDAQRKVQVGDTRTGRRLRSAVVADDASDLRALSRRFVVTGAKSREPGHGPRSLCFWDLERGTKWLELPVPEGFSVVGFSPDEAWFVFEVAPSAVVLVDLAAPRRRVRVEAKARLTAITLSRDGRLLATGDAQGEVRVWSTDGVLLGALEGHRSRVTPLAFSPDGALLASGSADTTALIWPRSVWEAEAR